MLNSQQHLQQYILRCIQSLKSRGPYNYAIHVYSNVLVRNDCVWCSSTLMEAVPMIDGRHDKGGSKGNQYDNSAYIVVYFKYQRFLLHEIRSVSAKEGRL